MVAGVGHGEPSLFAVRRACEGHLSTQGVDVYEVFLCSACLPRCIVLESPDRRSRPVPAARSRSPRSEAKARKLAAFMPHNSLTKSIVAGLRPGPAARIQTSGTRCPPRLRQPADPSRGR